MNENYIIYLELNNKKIKIESKEVTNSKLFILNYYIIIINDIIKIKVDNTFSKKLKIKIKELNKDKKDKKRRYKTNIARLLSILYIYRRVQYIKKRKENLSTVNSNLMMFNCYFNNSLSTFSITDRFVNLHYYIYLGANSNNKINHIIEGTRRVNINKLDYLKILKKRKESFNAITDTIKMANIFVDNYLKKNKT